MEELLTTLKNLHDKNVTLMKKIGDIQGLTAQNDFP